MAQTKNRKLLLSATSQKSLGKYRELGCSMYGKNYLGQGPLYIVFGPGDEMEISGVYQKRYKKGKPFYIRERFYFPKYPNTPKQLATRQNIRDAVLFWQGLTSDQKNFYNIRAEGQNYSGYNLCIKEYIQNK